MSPPHQLRQQTSNCSSLLIYRPRKDERLSWPSWYCVCHSTPLGTPIGTSLCSFQGGISFFAPPTDDHGVSLRVRDEATTVSLRATLSSSRQGDCRRRLRPRRPSLAPLLLSARKSILDRLPNAGRRRPPHATRMYPRTVGDASPRC